MVLMNGSKNARYASSLSNIPSGGGPKKTGLPPTVGNDSSVVSLRRSMRGGYCCLQTNMKLVGTTKSVSYKGSVGHILN